MRRNIVLIGLTVCAAAAECRRGTVCRVVDCAGSPRLEMNGRTVAGTAVMPSPRVKLYAFEEALREFAGIGVELFSDVWDIMGTHPVMCL